MGKKNVTLINEAYFTEEVIAGLKNRLRAGNEGDVRWAEGVVKKIEKELEEVRAKLNKYADMDDVYDAMTTLQEELEKDLKDFLEEKSKAVKDEDIETIENLIKITGEKLNYIKSEFYNMDNERLRLKKELAEQEAELSDYKKLDKSSEYIKKLNKILKKIMESYPLLSLCCVIQMELI